MSDVGSRFDEAGLEKLIRDAQSGKSKMGKGRISKKSIPLKSVYSNPNVYKHYPEAGNTPVHIGNMGEHSYGGYSPQGKIMILNPYAKGMTAKKMMNTLAHETQHVIQDLDNVPGGANNVAEAKIVASNMSKNAGSDAEGKFLNHLRKGVGKDDKIAKAAAYMRYSGNSGEAEARVTGNQFNNSRFNRLLEPQVKDPEAYKDKKQEERWAPTLKILGQESTQYGRDFLDRAAKRVKIK